MKKTGVQYIKCPRCELNYIQKKDKYCEVCKSEMKAGILKESDLEDLELEEGMEICPICKVNYLNEGETICSTCQEEQLSLNNKDDEPDWRGYVEKADVDDEEELDLLPVEEDDEIDEELEGAFRGDLDDFDDEEEDDEEMDDIDDELDEDFDEEFDSDDEDEDESDEDDDFDDDDDFTPRKKRK